MMIISGTSALGAHLLSRPLPLQKPRSGHRQSPWTTIVSTCLMVVSSSVDATAPIRVCRDHGHLLLAPLTAVNFPRIRKGSGDLSSRLRLGPFPSFACIARSWQQNSAVNTGAAISRLPALGHLNRLCHFFAAVSPMRRMFALSAAGCTSIGAVIDDDDVPECVAELSHSITYKSKAAAMASEALEKFLKTQRSLQPKDAEFISRNCPTYISKVVEASLQFWTTTKHSSVGDQLVIEHWLRKNEINELEPFLESIGLDPEKVEEVMPLLQMPLDGDQGLLKSIKILESMGISRRRLWDVIERNKQLLTLTPAELGATVDFLEGLGVRRGKQMVGLIQDSFFLTDNLAILQNLEKIGGKKHGMAEILKSDDAQGSPIDMPVGTFQERTDFLLESGLSKAEVAQSLKLFPHLLHLRLDNLKRKIQFFDSIGLERERMAKIIARWPLVFRHSVEKKLRPKIEMLQSLGVGRDGIAKILTRYPELGAVSLEDNLKQKVAFFEVNGLTGKRLVKLMTSHPRALTLSVNDLNRKLDFLVQKGFSAGSVEMVRALGVCITISVESMEARFVNLESLGLSFEEGRDVVKQQPAILTLSEKCIQEKVHYLLNNMNRSIQEVVRCPCYLLYSLELRIKPRHRVLSLLKSEGVLREEAYSLNTIMIMSEKRFMERFVISLGVQFPQVAAAYYKREQSSLISVASSGG